MEGHYYIAELQMPIGSLIPPGFVHFALKHVCMRQSRNVSLCSVAKGGGREIQ
jgi:hypothetical protein